MTFIAIAGNIAAGKTTLGRIIEKKLEFKLHEEPINPETLSAFYKDIENNVKPSERAFLFQKSFLGLRTAVMADAQMTGRNCIQDRTVFEDRYVFAESLHNQGFISDEKFNIYCSLYTLQMTDLKHPDLLVYLDAPIEKLRERINKRGRISEISLIDPNNKYLEHLDELYKKMMSKYEGTSIHIDTKELDLESNFSDQEYVSNLISGFLKYRLQNVKK